jgi:putative restriction endonuclease
LNLIEAAHIVPVGAPDSNDLTTNGLALCSLHHKAYDNGLIGVREDYHILANNELINRLQELGVGSGGNTFLSLYCNRILLPSNRADWPNPNFLREGMRYRGWKI